MKTYNRFYDQLYSLENLLKAYEKARKRKTTKPYVLEFEENLFGNLFLLQRELQQQTYRPAPLRTFILRDPKTRKISVSEFRDRVVHHAVCNIIEPLFEKSFIFDSYANRKRKGTLKAFQRFKYFQRKVTRNNTIKGFVLKADIYHYFETVDNAILLSVLKKKIVDEKAVQLITIILDNYLGKEPGKGMPLGNLTSQFFANVFLNELDQFVKHILKAKYYLRYVDDFVILHDSKEELQRYKEEINPFLQERLVLQLHPDKTNIIPLQRGIPFLGMKIFPHHTLIAKKNLRKAQNKLNLLCHEYKQKKAKYDDIYDFLEGWFAYAKHANTFKLRKRIGQHIEQLFPNEISTKEINQLRTAFPSKISLLQTQAL